MRFRDYVLQEVTEDARMVGHATLATSVVSAVFLLAKGRQKDTAFVGTACLGGALVFMASVGKRAYGNWVDQVQKPESMSRS